VRYQDGITSLKYKRDLRYVLVGDEPYLKDMFIRFAQSVFSEWEHFKFYPDTEAEAVSSINSGGLFAGRLIILYDFENMNVKKFVDISGDSQDCVIFVVGHQDSSRHMTAITGKSAVIECNKMREYGDDYPMWVASKIADGGYTKRESVESAIYSRVGPDMFSLSNEIRKLFLFKGDTKDISCEDVDAVVSLTAVKSSYDILDSLLKKDKAAAIRCLESYSQIHENFVELVLFLSHYMEKVYRILLLKESGTETNDIADIVGLPRYILKTKYLPKAMVLGKNFVAEKINQLCRLDVQIRNFRGNKKIAIENFILRFSE
jgi:DNA polymerase III delta subunit